MNKKNASPAQEPASSGSPAAENPQANSGSPAVTTTYDDLMKNGTAILESPTREALAELVDNIPADCRYSVGAVGRKQDGSAYTIRVEIIKNE
jgi:hypothetical protein